MQKTPIRQEIIFVTGKGGVGKSAVAAAIALKKSQSKRTLLVELGSQSFYKDYFRLPSLGFDPQNIKDNLDLALWSGTECLKEYARYLLKVESLYRLFFENSVTRSLINIAPGLAELAIMGKATSHPRKVGPVLNYDCLVIDAFATGHFLALLRAPQGMAEAISFGPMGEQSRSIIRVLKDPDQVQYCVVSIPEDLPIQEALELSQSIKTLTGIQPQQILNKYWKISIDILRQAPNDEKLSQFQNYLKSTFDRQEKLEKILNSQSGSSPAHQLPFVFSADPWEIISNLAKDLP
jgi:anion-transporting  ArsA/GET3 family ATPase